MFSRRRFLRLLAIAPAAVVGVRALRADEAPEPVTSATRLAIMSGEFKLDEFEINGLLAQHIDQRAGYDWSRESIVPLSEGERNALVSWFNLPSPIKQA